MMSSFEIVHAPRVSLTLNARDVEILLRCARSHYDRECKNTGIQGGILYGWKNALLWSGGDDQYTRTISVSELDTLLKVAEMADVLDIKYAYIYAELMKAMQALQGSHQ